MKSKLKPYWRTWLRAPKLPTPRLLAWINHLGTATVARSLVCNEFTVRQWKLGRPLSLKRAQELICNSQRQRLPDGTPLCYEDIFGLVTEERSEKREPPTIIPPRAPKPTPSPRRRRADRVIPKPKRAA